ncbi:MAG: phosphoserine phosphatase SerB [Methylophilaceae bacterium]
MKLVVQGQHALQHLSHIAALAGGGQFTQTTDKAYRLDVAAPVAEITAYCAAQQLDCAFVPDHLTLSNIGLLVMDMDSTLIAIECIDEVADMLDMKPQVAAITESAMRGEMEFSESLRRRVALLKGLDESALQKVYDERLKLSPGAEIMIATLKKNGIKTMLVSGGFTFFTDKLKARLGLDYAEANLMNIVDGRITGNVVGEVLDAQAKADHLTRTRLELGLEQSQVIALGDGANDLKMMAVAGAGIAYHAKPVVQAQATFALNYTGLEGVIGLLA